MTTTAPQSTPETGRGRRTLIPGLIRDNQNFRRLWAGQASSMLGDQVSFIALPLVGVLALDASPAPMGYLAAAGLIPNLLFALHAGALVDRVGRRRQIMVAADFGRALLLLSIPAAYLLDLLSLTLLYVVAFGVGTLSVLFQVSYSTLFISVGSRSQYVEGNSILQGTRSLSFVAGPSVGGVLVQILTAPITMLVDAASFLFFRAVPGQDPGNRAAGRDVRARPSRRWCPVHRRYAGDPEHAAVQRDHQLLQLHVLGAVRALRQPGARRHARSARRDPRRRLDRRRARLDVDRPSRSRARDRADIHRRLPAVHRPADAGAAGGWSAAADRRDAVPGRVRLRVRRDAAGHQRMSISASLVPDRLRARVAGAHMLVNYGIRPLGSLAGGALGATIGLQPTLWIATVGAMAGLVWSVPSPIRRLHDLPDQVE